VEIASELHLEIHVHPERFDKRRAAIAVVPGMADPLAVK
jgi:hypothetical protein